MSRASKPPRGPMSTRVFAKWFGVSYQAVDERIRKGDLPTSTKRIRGKSGKKGRLVVLDAAKCAAEWAANTTKNAPQVHVTSDNAKTNGNGHAPGPEAPSKPEPSPLVAATVRARLADAEARERDNAVKAGLLVRTDAVERMVGTKITAARTKMLGVPSRCKQRLPHLSPGDVLVIEELIREALDELADGRE